MDNWIVEQTKPVKLEINKFKAYYVPEITSPPAADNFPKYLKIKGGKRNRIFETKYLRGSTASKRILIREDTFPDLNNVFEITKLVEVSRFRFYLHKIWNDKEQFIALIILIFGLGLVIDSFFDIGKTHPIAHYSFTDMIGPFSYSIWYLILKGFSLFLKVFALFLTFWKGFVAASK